MAGTRKWNYGSSGEEGPRQEFLGEIFKMLSGALPEWRHFVRSSLGKNLKRYIEVEDVLQEAAITVLKHQESFARLNQLELPRCL